MLLQPSFFTYYLCTDICQNYSCNNSLCIQDGINFLYAKPTWVIPLYILLLFLALPPVYHTCYPSTQSVLILANHPDTQKYDKYDNVEEEKKIA